MDSSDKAKITFHLQTLPSATAQALAFLSQQEWLRKYEWYLAGGTALALQAGNRISVDLDFFTPQKDFDSQIIVTLLEQHGWLTTLREKGTLYGLFMDAKVSFISLPFFLPQQELLPYGTVHILDQDDIAVMKIIAISQRGRKRDFFDLFWYVKHRMPLIDVVQKLDMQYPNVKHNYHHIVKSLTYFEEAEEDPDPQIYFEATWKEVKDYFVHEIARVGVDVLRLS